MKKITEKWLREKLSLQMQRNRDPLIREKVHLFYLALKLGNASKACERRNISRDFYYRWWGRLKKSGYKVESLNPKSTRPKSSPRRIAKNLERRILRLGFLGNGSQQIEMQLHRQGVSVSRSTIQLVLRRRQMKNPLKPKWKKKKSHRKRYEVPIPGWRVQVDVKYGPRIFGSPGNFVYVAIDECTRWRFARAYSTLNQFMTVQFLEELKQKAPFSIRCLQSDNGQEFSFKLFGNGCGEHKMAQWCKKNGIIHRLIPPGEKELNGKVERSHRIDKENFYWKARRKSLKEFNRQLDAWVYSYNHKRPHGSLSAMTPVEKLGERNSVLPWKDLDEYWMPWLTEYRKWLRDQNRPKDCLYTQLQKELLFYNYYWAEDHLSNPLSGRSPLTTLGLPMSGISSSAFSFFV